MKGSCYIFWPRFPDNLDVGLHCQKSCLWSILNPMWPQMALQGNWSPRNQSDESICARNLDIPLGLQLPWIHHLRSPWIQKAYYAGSAVAPFWYVIHQFWPYNKFGETAGNPPSNHRSIDTMNCIQKWCLSKQTKRCPLYLFLTFWSSLFEWWGIFARDREPEFLILLEKCFIWVGQIPLACLPMGFSPCAWSGSLSWATQWGGQRAGHIGKDNSGRNPGPETTTKRIGAS